MHGIVKHGTRRVECTFRAEDTGGETYTCDEGELALEALPVGAMKTETDEAVLNINII